MLVLMSTGRYNETKSSMSSKDFKETFLPAMWYMTNIKRRFMESYFAKVGGRNVPEPIAKYFSDSLECRDFTAEQRNIWINDGKRYQSLFNNPTDKNAFAYCPMAL